ncbi:MAG TPA: hypothetical protein VHF22_05790, partial [Planctomycetota bacterium]|nr:hypothetical protein [Planctomycetota bacterium]
LRRDAPPPLQGQPLQWDPRLNFLALEVEGLLVYPIEKLRKVVRGLDQGSLQDFLMILAKRVSERRAGQPPQT